MCASLHHLRLISPLAFAAFSIEKSGNKEKCKGSYWMCGTYNGKYMYRNKADAIVYFSKVSAKWYLHDHDDRKRWNYSSDVNYTPKNPYPFSINPGQSSLMPPIDIEWKAVGDERNTDSPTFSPHGMPRRPLNLST